MKKAFILFAYAIALYIVLSKWYAEGNSGIPNPRAFSGATYIYAILGLVSDFTGAFTVPLAAGATLALYWQTKNTKKPASSGGGKLQLVPAPANPKGVLRIPPVQSKVG